MLGAHRASIWRQFLLTRAAGGLRANTISNPARIYLSYSSTEGGAPDFDFQSASMASNSKGKKKTRTRGEVLAARAPVPSAPSTRAAAGIPSGTAAAAAAASGWWPGAPFGSPGDVDSSQANPCVNPWYLCSEPNIFIYIFYL